MASPIQNTTQVLKEIDELLANPNVDESDKNKLRKDRKVATLLLDLAYFMEEKCSPTPSRPFSSAGPYLPSASD